MRIGAGREMTGAGNRAQRMLGSRARPEKVEKAGRDLSTLPAGLRRLGYYGLALLLAALGVIVRVALTRLIGEGLPTYITFYPFVMLAALLGGWGPGLLAVLATAAVADYWLLPPAGLFKIESMVDLVGLAFFCIMGLFVSVVAELYRRLRGHLEDLVVARTSALRRANEQLQVQAEELQTQAEELQAQTGELTTANQELRQREQALRESEEALRELNATLESKVAERTAELEHRARQLQKLTLELTEAEERERKRLAQLLHDDLQQVLAAAKFHVGLLGNRVKPDAALHNMTVQVDGLLGDAIDKSRHLSHELSAPVLADSDLFRALEWLVQQMQAQHGFKIHLATCKGVEVTSEPVRVLLYKAAQELLFNVIKHAGVREATLRLRHRRGCIWLSVSDRGRGFDPAQADHALGFGLLSIRERVGCLGGRLRICSAIGRGSTFVIAVPDTGPQQGR